MFNHHQLLKEQQKNLEIQNLTVHLRILSHRYAKLFNASPISYFTLSNQGQILNLNQAAISLLKRKKKDLINQLLTNFISHRSKKIFKDYIQQLFGRNPQQKCNVFFNIDGKDNPYILTCILDSYLSKVIITAHPIKKYSQHPTEIIPIIYHSLCEAVVAFDNNFNVISANPTFCQLFTCSENEINGVPLSIIDKETILITEMMQQHLKKTGHWMAEASHQNSDYLIKINTVYHDQHEIICHIAILIDISAQKSCERMIQHNADYDALTKLPNSRLFRQLLNQEIKCSTFNHQKFALISIDIDKFKWVNDSYGHSIGDDLLKKFSSRLKKTVRSTDIIARIGGDEFNIIIKNIDQYGLIEKIAESILASMNKPFKIQKNIIPISISLGIVLFPKTETNQKNLLRFADEAMYLTKRNGGNGFTIHP
jgi:diguanylate cyclase (GGDEF)-like protein/PAS domain S-box-containing protein